MRNIRLITTERKKEYKKMKNEMGKEENDGDKKRSIYSLQSVIMTILSFFSFQRVLV